METQLPRTRVTNDNSKPKKTDQLLIRNRDSCFYLI